jgi:hypothetical protein
MYIPIRLLMVALAKEYLDLEIAEDPPGSNRGEIVSRIIRSEGGTPGEPWCNYFWRRINHRAHAYANVPQIYEHGGSTRNLVDEATARHKLTTDPQPGDACCFKGDHYHTGYEHTGMFLDWIDKGAGTYYTIEANVGNRVKRCERNVNQPTTWVSAE